MKKEYLILIALILLLSAYLFFNKENKEHFTLPVIADIETAKISRLEIAKEQDTVTLMKKDGKWMIQQLERPADKMAVENMLSAIQGFRLSALVSQKKDVQRYELDPDKKIHVKILAGNNSVLEFFIGKTAPTFNHTFVMMAGDSNIYHAKGSFRSYFEKSGDEIRDKKIMSFKEKTITSLTIEQEGISKIFTAIEEKKENQEPEIAWKSGDGSAVDKTALTDLLSALAELECETFLAEDNKAAVEGQVPFCRIKLTGDTDYSLHLFKIPGDEKLSGLSSMNSDAFVLSKFNGDDIIDKTETLLGIKKEEKSE